MMMICLPDSENYFWFIENRSDELKVTCCVAVVLSWFKFDRQLQTIIAWWFLDQTKYRDTPWIDLFFYVIAGKPELTNGLNEAEAVSRFHLIFIVFFKCLRTFQLSKIFSKSSSQMTVQEKLHFASLQRDFSANGARGIWMYIGGNDLWFLATTRLDDDLFYLILRTSMVQGKQVWWTESLLNRSISNMKKETNALGTFSCGQ